MPYCAHVLGFEGDIARVDRGDHEHAIEQLQSLDGWDFALSDLERTVQSLRDEFGGLKLAVAAEGEEGERILFDLSGGRLETHYVDAQARHRAAFERLRGRSAILGAPQRSAPGAVASPEGESPLCRGSIKERLAAAEKLSRRRDPADVAEIIEALEHAGNRTQKASKLRAELFNALSWHETERVQARLVEGLRDEGPLVADKILYVLWRQEALIARLPQLLDEAWQQQPRHDDYVERLIRAVKGAEELTLSDAWRAAAEPLLLRRLGLATEEGPAREASMVELLEQLFAALDAGAPWHRHICRALGWESAPKRRRALDAVEERFASAASSAGDLRARQLSIELLAACGLDGDRLTELADGLPPTGPLRDLLELPAEPLPDDAVAWRAETSAFSLTWLERAGALLADDTGGVSLLDAGGHERARSWMNETTPGFVVDAAGAAPMWVGGASVDGPKLLWIAVEEGAGLSVVAAPADPPRCSTPRSARRRLSLLQLRRRRLPRPARRTVVEVPRPRRGRPRLWTGRRAGRARLRLLARWPALPRRSDRRAAVDQPHRAGLGCRALDRGAYPARVLPRARSRLSARA